MTRRAQRRDEHDVESECQAGEIGPGHQKGGGGARDAAALPRQDRGGSGLEIPAQLDLDDREHPAAARQNVDLAGRAAPMAGNDLPAAQPQVPSAQKLGQAASALRFQPLGLGGTARRRAAALIRTTPCAAARARGRKASGGEYRSRRRAEGPPRASCACRAGGRAACRYPLRAALPVRAARRRSRPRRAAGLPLDNAPPMQREGRGGPPRTAWSTRGPPRRCGRTGSRPCRKARRRAAMVLQKTPMSQRASPTGPAFAAAPLNGAAGTRQTEKPRAGGLTRSALSKPPTVRAPRSPAGSWRARLAPA